MANDVKGKIEDFKRTLKKLQDNYNQAKGARDSKLKTLKDDFGFDSIAKAETELAVLKKKSIVIKKKRDDAIEDFEDKYKDLLEA
jgi:ribonuclease HII